MNYLVDTHLLLWATILPEKLSKSARQRLEGASTSPWFSTASIWETAIKRGLGRSDFDVEPRRLRRALLDSGWSELAISSEHAAAVHELPPLHKDPFDRMLLAQARTEGFTLLTSDKLVAQYPGSVQKV